MSSLLQQIRSATATAARAILLLWLPSLLLTTGCRNPNPHTIRAWNPPHPPTHHANPTTSTNLQLLIYNIWGLPAWMNGAPPSRYADIATEIEQLQPDFIFLQEAWSTASLSAIPQNTSWSAAGYQQPDCFFQRSGLVCLSRHPILEAKFYPFKKVRLPDSIVQKGALKITIDLQSGHTLNLWNVHLQSGPPNPTRIAQIHELTQWVQNANDNQIADIVAGDFNCTPDSPAYALLVHHFGEDLTSKHPNPHLITYLGSNHPSDPACTLDYAFLHTKHQQLAVTAQTHPFVPQGTHSPLSDHIGLNVQLDIQIPTTLLSAISEEPHLIQPKPALD
jgi:endonuclease/exonuclease/phosphatase family metal-dependent hydrolase